MSDRDETDDPPLPPVMYVMGDGRSPERASLPAGSTRWGAGARFGALLGAIVLFAFGVFAGRGTITVATGSAGAAQTEPTSVVDSSTTSLSSGADSSDTTAPANTRASPTPGDDAPAEVVLPPDVEPLPGTSGWELVGFQWSQRQSVGPSNVVRYRPSGTVAVAPVPGLASTGPLTFAATNDAAVILPWDNVPGYLVTADQPAEELSGVLARSQMVFPGADPEHLWAVFPDRDPQSIVEVDSAGNPTGVDIVIPAELGIQEYSLYPDGSGNLVGEGSGGSYELGADGPHLITEEHLLAIGPTTYLTGDCAVPEQCTFDVIDREPGQSTQVVPVRSALRGVVSPDGRYAALLDGDAKTVTLLNLVTGDRTVVPGIAVYGGPGQTTVAFTPDGRHLLAATPDGIVPIDTGSLSPLPPLPINDVVTMTILPSP